MGIINWEIDELYSKCSEGIKGPSPTVNLLIEH